MTGLLRPGPALSGHPRLTQPPGHRRILLLPLFALLMCAGLIAWYLHEFGQPGAGPKALDETSLEGPRGPSCLRLVIGQDVSGSMTDFANARDAALAQLLRWAPQNLRADDEIAVVEFAEDAAVRVPPTRIGSGVGVSGSPPNLSGSSTLVAPALDKASDFADTTCLTVLVLLSDGQIGDLPPDEQSGWDVLREHDLNDVRLLVPGERIDVPPNWSTSFPSAPPTRFDGLDENDTALTIGRTIADLTRQNLVKKQVP